MNENITISISILQCAFKKKIVWMKISMPPYLHIHTNHTENININFSGVSLVQDILKRNLSLSLSYTHT
jgi:hypothetical protein